MNLALRLARRELRGGIGGLRIFLACLALGVATIAGAGSLSKAIEAGLTADARLLLGGDMEVRLTHQDIGGDQRTRLESLGRLSRVVELRSMARGTGPETHRTLVEIKAVDASYPLYGDIRLAPAAPLPAVLEAKDGLWGAAADSNLLARLGVHLGDSIKVGEALFQIRAVIDHEPDRVATVFTFGPRLLVSAGSLPATRLVQPGSMVRNAYRVALAPGLSPDSARDDLIKTFPSAGWQIRGPNEAAPGLRNFLGNMGLFLNLVGLTALLVGGLGVANAVNAYLDGRARTVAMLKCLGASGGLVFRVYAAQIAALAAVGVAIGLAVGGLVPFAGAWVIGDALPVKARFGVYPEPLALAAAFGFLTAAAFALWPLARARDIEATALFRVAAEVGLGGRGSLPRMPYIVAVAVIACILGGLAVASADNHRLAAWFVAVAVVSLGLFHLAAVAVRHLAARAGAGKPSRTRRPRLRLALANLHRPGAATHSVILSLGLGLTVLVTVALIEGNLDRQIASRMPSQAPAFFFIDIQPDQTADFLAAVAEVPEAGAARLAATVRGRITRLHGGPVDEAKVDPSVRWVVRGDRGLTSAAERPKDARIIAGTWWPEDYRGPPLVSFAADVARGMGLNVGDQVTLNVLGRDIGATIANLREVDWSSLGMNFSFILSPGVLEGAPHTFVATVHAPPSAEDALERAVTDRLANVSAIRVRQALEAVRSMVGQAGTAVRATAAVAMVAGALVLAGALAAGHRRRVRESVILKVLGARRRDVLATYVYEYGIIGVATGAIAAALGSVAGWAVVRFIMDMEWSFQPAVAGITVLVCLAVTLAAGFAGTWFALGTSAAPVLRNE